MGHIHDWLDLKNYYIDIIRRRLDAPKIQSLYRIVKVCRARGVCHAGMTGDDIVFEDVRESETLEDEFIIRKTGRLRSNKEV